MENMKVKITFKSGSVRIFESSDFKKGQFRQWCEVNLVRNNFERYGFVIWNNVFVNVAEIETIDEI